MKSCIVILIALAQAQSFKPEHKYVAGDNDAYTVKVTAASSAGEIQVSSTTSRKVAKVYDNGDADILTTITELTITVGGQPMSPPDPTPNTTRFNKLGIAISGAEKSRGLSFLQYGLYFGERELKVGAANEFDQIDKANPKNHTKSTARLLSLEGGKAKIAIAVDSYVEPTETPMHLDGVVIVDASTCRLVSFNGTAKNLPPLSAGLTVSSATFSLERKG